MNRQAVLLLTISRCVLLMQYFLVQLCGGGRQPHWALSSKSSRHEVRQQSTSYGELTAGCVTQLC